MNHTDLLEVVIQLYGSSAAGRPLGVGPVYIEIGVAQAANFNRIASHCEEAHAVDVPDNPWGTPNVSPHRLWNAGSDEFFKAYDGPQAQLIFIDGDHTATQAWKDFQHAKEILAPLGTIALHDTWPPDAHGSSGTGTVWQVAYWIENSTEHDCYTLPTQTGLTLMRPRVQRF